MLFKNVNLSYNNQQVLNNLTFEIKPSEKVGIVGRTGAGKSSIIQVLYRMTEFEGDITIDGVNIKSLQVQKLRESITIIPQEPSIFHGSVRQNLDPRNLAPDDVLWSVLEDVS